MAIRAASKPAEAAGCDIPPKPAPPRPAAPRADSSRADSSRSRPAMKASSRRAFSLATFRLASAAERSSTLCALSSARASAVTVAGSGSGLPGAAASRTAMAASLEMLCASRVDRSNWL